MIVEATAPRRENVRNTFWFSQKLSMTGSEGEAYDSIERKSRTTAAGGTAEKSRTVGRPLQNGGALRGKNRSRVW